MPILKNAVLNGFLVKNRIKTKFINYLKAQNTKKVYPYIIEIINKSENSPHLINNVLIWKATKEGQWFWNDIDDEYRKYWIKHFRE